MSRDHPPTAADADLSPTGRRVRAIGRDCPKCGVNNPEHRTVCFYCHFEPLPPPRQVAPGEPGTGVAVAAPEPEGAGLNRQRRYDEATRHKFVRDTCGFVTAFIFTVTGIIIAILVSVSAELRNKPKVIKPAGWLACLAAAPFAALAARSDYKLRRCLAADAREVLRHDTRPPVLYLRSFRDDGSGLRMPSWVAYKSHERTESDEERMVRYLRSVGPVVAIGRPGESLPELGAARMYVSDDQWQAVVVELMSRAALVVLRLGSSPGLLWEFDTLATTVPPGKILLRLGSAEGIPTDLWRRLPCGGVPAPRGRYLTFADDWTPTADQGLRSALARRGLVPHPLNGPKPPLKWYAAILGTLLIALLGVWYWLDGWRHLNP